MVAFLYNEFHNWSEKLLNKKQPDELKIQKPLSLYLMKFDEVVDVLLATKPKKREIEKKSEEKRASGESEKV